MFYRIYMASFVTLSYRITVLSLSRYYLVLGCHKISFSITLFGKSYFSPSLFVICSFFCSLIFFYISLCIFLYVDIILWFREFLHNKLFPIFFYFHYLLEYKAFCVSITYLLFPTKF
jgi:hypothetical protein